MSGYVAQLTKRALPWSFRCRPYQLAIGGTAVGTGMNAPLRSMSRDA
jgi:fumarate hydratase class II